MKTKNEIKKEIKNEIDKTSRLIEAKKKWLNDPDMTMAEAEYIECDIDDLCFKKKILEWVLSLFNAKNKKTNEKLINLAK